MKKALIFGQCGFAGKYLTEELKNHGYTVYGSDVAKTGHADLCDGFFAGDLLDPGCVLDIVKQTEPDVIVNLAAISSVGLSWKLPQKTMDVNVNGGLNILEAARAAVPAARILFVGSSEEYAVTDRPISEKTALNANNPYGISKLALEEFSDIYRERYGMKIYHVRAFNHTGIGQRTSFVIPGWVAQAAAIEKSGKPGVMKVGNTDVTRDFSDVRDIVRAYRMVVESDDCSVIYNIGSGTAIRLGDLLSYIVSLSSQPIRVEKDPALFRPADNPVICCDHSLITQKLGWKPAHTLQETVREMYAYDLAHEAQER